MLVLTRRPGQETKIGDNIVVKILKVEGNSVRLGIEAPRDVDILRDDAKIKHRKGSED